MGQAHNHRVEKPSVLPPPKGPGRPSVHGMFRPAHSPVGTRGQPTRGGGVRPLRVVVVPQLFAFAVWQKHTKVIRGSPDAHLPPISLSRSRANDIERRAGGRGGRIIQPSHLPCISSSDRVLVLGRGNTLFFTIRGEGGSVPVVDRETNEVTPPPK